MARPTESPRFLRFAQALALVSGIAAPACSMHHVTPPGGDAGGDAAPLADAGPDAPFVDRCAACECIFGGDTPPPPTSCEARGTPECCYAVGPLAPPDLRA